MHHPVFYDDRTSDIGAINSAGLPIGRVAGSHRPTEEHVQAVADFLPNTGTTLLLHAIIKRMMVLDCGIRTSAQPCSAADEREGSRMIS